MKHTLRDLLLARHRDRQPALDRLCHEALAEVQGARERLSASQIWHELFDRPRRAWAALAVVWLLIGWVYANTGPMPGTNAENSHTDWQQRELLAQLSEDLAPRFQ